VILAAPVSREAAFDALARRLAAVGEVRWLGLVGWHEEELFGWVELERRLTSERPREAALTSWLLRDAEAGERVLCAAGSEVGGEGRYLAIALQPGGSTAGFVVVALGGRAPRGLVRALAASADALETAFAGPAVAESAPVALPAPLVATG